MFQMTVQGKCPMVSLILMDLVVFVSISNQVHYKIYNHETSSLAICSHETSKDRVSEA